MSNQGTLTQEAIKTMSDQQLRELLFENISNTAASVNNLHTNFSAYIAGLIPEDAWKTESVSDDIEAVKSRLDSFQSAVQELKSRKGQQQSQQ